MGKAGVLQFSLPGYSTLAHDSVNIVWTFIILNMSVRRATLVVYHSITNSVTSAFWYLGSNTPNGVIRLWPERSASTPTWIGPILPSLT
jgi:hypothetical protein